jgi:transcriptional regulator GlxA family with amidase domain
MPSKKKLIAFTLYSGVTPLDLVGPLTVLRNLAIRSPYRTIVVAEQVEPFPTDTPLRIVPAATFDEVPDPYAVVVPGGGAATIPAMEDGALLAYVGAAAKTASLVASTGTGSLILAAAGPLRGRRAATHWAYADILESLGATHVRDRWVKDGPFLTSAGGSAGIDMMLYLLATLTSEPGARLAQMFMEYDPQPPFGGIDWAHVGRLPRLLRGAIGGAAPALVAKPKRLSISEPAPVRAG